MKLDEYFAGVPYVDFKRAFYTLKKKAKSGESTSAPDTLKSYKETTTGEEGHTKFFYEDIDKSMKTMRVFDIDDNVKRLLLMTKAPKTNNDLKLPFPKIFLNIVITKEELRELGVEAGKQQVFGILFRQGTLIFEDLKNVCQKHFPIECDENDEIFVVGKNLRITTGNQTPDWISVSTFNVLNVVDYEPMKEFKINVKRVDRDIDKRTRKIVTDFIINFINYLNTPDIVIIKTDRSEKNRQRRIKQGKHPLPTTYRVQITRPLKVYLNQLSSGNHFQYSHQFWVRGHWRTLKHPRYKQNVGKKKWIYPFVKGEGMLIEKDYLIEGEKVENK